MEKRIIGALFFILGVSNLLSAQQTLSETIEHDGLTREYIIYIPEIYNGNESVPLLFSLHGWTQYNYNFINTADYRPIADTANFILIVPQATLENGQPKWNINLNASLADDLGFINALIDSTSQNYNINTNRVYVTGFSNGGYMSYVLACKLSDRIAAIAPVKGKMKQYLIDGDCDCQHPMPIFMIYNTADHMVSYYNSPSVTDAISYWTNFNNCNTEADVTVLDDIDPNDDVTVRRRIYADGYNCISIEFLKENDGTAQDGIGDHSYPKSTTANPWYYHGPAEIWGYFRQYDINGLIGCVTTEQQKIKKVNTTISLFPNPATELINIVASTYEKKEYKIYNLYGKLISKGIFYSKNKVINLNGMPSGIYFIKVEEELFKLIKTE